MSGEEYYQDGGWNAVCFTCGFRFKADELRRQWQGYWVCDSCWEPRQPQDFVRAIPDVQTPPWVQPRPAASFIVRCSPNGSSAIPGYAIPGCAIPGYISPFFDPSIDPPDDGEYVDEFYWVSGYTGGY